MKETKSHIQALVLAFKKPLFARLHIKLHQCVLALHQGAKQVRARSDGSRNIPVEKGITIFYNFTVK